MTKIEILRSKAVVSLTEQERSELFDWLISNGFQLEYEQKLDEFRASQRMMNTIPPKSRTLIPKPDSVSEVTVRTSTMMIQSPQSQSAEEPFEDQPDQGQMVTAQDQLPETAPHRLADLVSHAAADAFEVQRAKTSPSLLISSNRPNEGPTLPIADERLTTPILDRPKAKVRRIESHTAEQVVTIETQDTSVVTPHQIPLTEMLQLEELKGESFRPSTRPKDNRPMDRATTDRRIPFLENRPSVQRLFGAARRVISGAHGRTMLVRRYTSEPSRRWWFLTAAMLGVVILGFVLVRERAQVRERQTQHLSEVQKLFQTGNYHSLAQGIAMLDGEDFELGFFNRLLDVSMSVFGGSSLEEDFTQSKLEFELKLRSVQVFIYQDESDLRGAEILLARPFNSQMKKFARALINVSRRDLTDKDLDVFQGHYRDGHRIWVQGVVSEAIGKIDDAESFFRDALSVDFSHPYAGLSLAQLIARRTDHVGALTVLEQILVSRPNFTMGRLEAARQSMKVPERRRFAKQELDFLDQHAKLASMEKSIVAMMLAEDEVRRGDLGAAEKRLTSLLRQKQDEAVLKKLAVVLFSQSKITTVESLLNEESWISDETKLELWAEVYLRRGQPDEALKRLRNITVKTKHSEMLYNHGLAMKLLILEFDEKPLSDSIRDEVESRISKVKETEEVDSGLALLKASIQGEHDKLIELSRKRIRENDSTNGVGILSWRFVAAWARIQKKELTRGLSVLSRGKNMSSPSSPELWLRCLIESLRLRFESSKVACLEAIELTNFEPAKGWLAQTYELRGDYERVIGLLPVVGKQELSQLDQAFRVIRSAYRSGNRDALKTVTQEAATLGSQVTLFSDGLTDILNGNRDDGLSRLRRVATQRKEDARTLTLLGEIFARYRKPREAEQLFERAIALKSEPQPYLGLATLLLEHGHVQRALTVARDAEKTAKQSLCQPEERAKAVALQAIALMRLKGRSNLRKAQRLARRAMRISGDVDVVWILQGMLAEKAGKKQAAKTSYRQILQTEPNHQEAQFRLGRVLLSENQTKSEGRALLESLSRLEERSIWVEKARQLLP